MPYEGPGKRRDEVAGKQVQHGNPAADGGFACIAAKSGQLPPFMDPTTPATQMINVGEHYTQMLTGVHSFPSSLLPGGAGAGAPLWINPADNSLHSATGAGFLKLGVVDHIDTVLGLAYVNLLARGQF